MMTNTELPYKTVGKGLLVLQAFSVERPLLGVTELAQRLDMDPSSMSRLLRSIERCGFVERDPATGKYRLGWEILRLAGVILATIDIRQICRPLLHRLAETSGETPNLCVLKGSDVVNVDEVPSPQSVKLVGWIGRRTPIHATAAGKALVAWLPRDEIKRLLPAQLPAYTERTITSWERFLDELADVRARGFAMTQEENQPGVNAVAAPIWDHTGRVVAALAVAGPAYRLPPERLLQIGAEVREAAREASRSLGGEQLMVIGQAAQP